MVPARADVGKFALGGDTLEKLILPPTGYAIVGLYRAGMIDPRTDLSNGGKSLWHCPNK